MDRKIGTSNPGGNEIFRGPPSLLYNGYRVSFPGVKWPGRGVNHPPPSSAQVKEIVEQYLYSPSEPSLPVTEKLFYLSQKKYLRYLIKAIYCKFKLFRTEISIFLPN